MRSAPVGAGAGALRRRPAAGAEAPTCAVVVIRQYRHSECWPRQRGAPGGCCRGGGGCRCGWCTGTRAWRRRRDSPRRSEGARGRAQGWGPGSGRRRRDAGLLLGGLVFAEGLHRSEQARQLVCRTLELGEPSPQRDQLATPHRLPQPEHRRKRSLQTAHIPRAHEVGPRREALLGPRIAHAQVLVHRVVHHTVTGGGERIDLLLAQHQRLRADRHRQRIRRPRDPVLGQLRERRHDEFRAAPRRIRHRVQAAAITGHRTAHPHCAVLRVHDQRVVRHRGAHAATASSRAAGTHVADAIRTSTPSTSNSAIRCS